MKTARRKLAELAAHGKALEFAGAFSERWTNENPEVLGYCYIEKQNCNDADQAEDKDLFSLAGIASQSPSMAKVLS